MAEDREMNLDEWCAKLPKHHLVNTQLKELKDKSESGGSVSCEAHRPDIEKLKKDFENREMNLYKVILRFACREFTFYVIAKNLQDAGDLAIKTFKKYDYGDCHLHTTELIASEGQYAKPDILLLAEEITK